jgi:hypothetical protein
MQRKEFNLSTEKLCHAPLPPQPFAALYLIAVSGLAASRDACNWHSTTGRFRINGRRKSGGDLTLFPLGSSTGSFGGAVAPSTKMLVDEQR